MVARAGRFLMIRRAAHILAGNAWCFVGGGLEPGESQAEGVVREFFEEVGGHVRPREKVWEYVSPTRHLRLHWWRAELLSDEFTLNPDEVAEIRWCTPAEIDALPDVLASNRQFLDLVRRGLIEAGDCDAPRPQADPRPQAEPQP